MSVVKIMLEELWFGLMPGVGRSGRISKEWGDIGFQGVDPATDFRGMGVLGLQHLHYFASCRGLQARRALARSAHPPRFYPFAITGINISRFPALASWRILPLYFSLYFSSLAVPIDYNMISQYS